MRLRFLIRVYNADLFIQSICNAPVFSSNTIKALKRQNKSVRVANAYEGADDHVGDL